jgi:hypothetical protein
MSLSEREKNYWNNATTEDMDKVQVIEEKLVSVYNYDKVKASKLAVILYLKANPDKFNQTGGRYKKHKTLKRKHSSKKHRKNTNKSRKHKRSRYHRKSKK